MRAPRYYALRALGLLPEEFRRSLVNAVAPSYILGAMCWLEDDDGRVLLVKNTYRDQWVFPGGLVDKGETPHDAAIRELHEETKLDITLLTAPVITVDPTLRRIEFTYKAELANGVTPDDCTIDFVEIVDAKWFRPEELPSIDHEYDGLAIAMAQAGDSSQLLYATWANDERILTPALR